MALTSDWAGSSGWLQWWAGIGERKRGRGNKETKEEERGVLEKQFKVGMRRWAGRGFRGATEKEEKNTVKERKKVKSAKVDMWGKWRAYGICTCEILSKTNYCSRLCFPLNYTYVFAMWADSVLTNAFRLKTTPSEVGQTSARNGALQ